MKNGGASGGHAKIGEQDDVRWSVARFNSISFARQQRRPFFFFVVDGDSLGLQFDTLSPTTHSDRQADRLWEKETWPIE